MTTDLERELVGLGEQLDVPEAPHLASRVGTELRAAVRAPAPRRWRRVVALVVAAVAALVGVSFVPAVADWLGIRGVEVHQQPPPSPPAGQGLDLGRQVTLTEARRVAGFRPPVPRRPGRPEAVWVDTRAAVPIVSLVWDGGPLVSEFRAAVARDTILHKFAGPGVRIESLTVKGHPALWVEGTHAVALQVGNDVIFDRLRLADSTLLVELDDLTVRIETRAGRAEAIRIAESIPGT